MSQIQVPIQNTQLWDQITFGKLVWETDSFTIHEGLIDASEVRITTLSNQLSEQPKFRAVFRTDICQLQQLNHASIASIVDWAEHAGTIFYVTETGSGVPLQQFLEQHSLKWEEFVDIAWQISSALQHVHNAGFTHGGLHQESILIDKALRIGVCDFGLQRWIQSAKNNNVASLFPDAAQADLDQLGKLLEWLIIQIPEDVRQRLTPQIADIKGLIQLSSDPHNDVMARDFQGHLGDLLLQDSGDVIDMIDHRQGQQTSRRSIIDELFDDEDQFKKNDSEDVALPNQPDYIVAGMILAFVGLIAVLLMLGY